MLTLQKRLIGFLCATLLLMLAACNALPEGHPEISELACKSCHVKKPLGLPDPLPVRNAGQSSGSGVNLANTKWMLVSYGQPDAPTPTLADSTVTLVFYTDGRTGGSASCNAYDTPYTLNGDTISFGEITSTMKTCKQESMSQQEVEYFRALQTAGRFAAYGDWLTIEYDDGQGILTWVKYPES